MGVDRGHNDARKTLQERNAAPSPMGAGNGLPRPLKLRKTGAVAKSDKQNT